MLQSLLPKAYGKFLSMPFLGSIVDGFDDWLAANGYTRGSRKYSIRMLPHVDANLRLRQAGEIANLTQPVFQDCWRNIIQTYPRGAGTVGTLGRYLAANGLIADDRKLITTATPFAVILSEEYANHLSEVRGFAASTVSHHRYTVQCFLKHLDAESIALGSIQAGNIESYITKTGKRLSRASLQHDIGALRGFLRFLAIDGRVPDGLALLIDTPRHRRQGPRRTRPADRHSSPLPVRAAATRPTVENGPGTSEIY